jgi:hypothetical protein
MYRDTPNVEPETLNYTSTKSSHRNSDKTFKEKCGGHTRKTCNRFTIKDSYTWNITRNNKERNAV